MGNAKKARDVDRDLAIDFVEAAWADGQLNRAEFDTRVDRLLRARTLNELERDLADLQGPDGAPWRPDGAAVPVTHLARDRARDRAAARVATASKGSNGRSLGVLVAVGLFCVAGIGGWLAIASDTPDDPTGWPRVVEVASASPVSAQGYRALVAGLDDAMGETSAFEVRLQEHGAAGLFPAGPTGDEAQRRTWDGQVWSEPTTSASPRERFNLQMISADTVEEAYVQASLALESDVMVELRLGIEQVAGVRSCLQATSSTPDGESITESYDCQGNVIDADTDE